MEQMIGHMVLVMRVQERRMREIGQTATPGERRATDGARRGRGEGEASH
jgi:hypothetical protein